MEIGIDSFALHRLGRNVDQRTGAAESLAHLLERIERADRCGLDAVGIGEHHRPEFLDSAPALILAAAAVRTRRVRLTSAVTVLSAVDPVRLFQQFATLDLLSQGRAEIVVGRGSATEAFPLFGLPSAQYDTRFAENLDLLLTLREQEEVHWSGKYRAPLTGQGVYPRPLQTSLPVWLGVGGTPESFVRAGTLGLPLMVAIIGGETRQFRPLVDLYREAGQRAGHPPERLRVGLHSPGYIAFSLEEAADDYYPGYAHMVDTLGAERGWPPSTMAQFEAQTGPDGAFLVGEPAAVAAKIVRHAKALGGLDRVMLQMDNSGISQAKLLRSIERLGEEVAQLVRQATGKSEV